MKLTKEQQQLAERGLKKAKRMARYFAARWPSVGFEDLVGVGSEAAVTTALDFDPERHASYDTFAYKRIRGAMFDLARDVFRHASPEEKAISGIVARDEPLEPEASDFFADFHNPDSRSPYEAVVVGLERVAAGLVAGILGSSLHAGDNDIDHKLDVARHSRELEGALLSLEDPEKSFIRGFYFEEKTLDTLAAELGTSKRTAQRIHERGKEWLAARLRAAVSKRTG